MARPRSRKRPSAQWSALVLPGVLVLVSLIGFGVLASSMGWFGSDAPTRRGAPAGTIAIPAAAIDIPAYSRVRLEHLVDPRTSDLRAIYLPEGSILPETMVDARQIIGRVVRNDKRSGELFSKHDFFAPGTREGIVAGIPAGKRALRIDASKVNGIVGLARGDRFDLVATLDLRRAKSNPVVVGNAGTRSLGSLGSAVQASIVVEDGAVVQPLETRAIPGQKTQLVQEMVIAVAPDEVESITKALHSGARVDCVPRSGQPEGPDAAPDLAREHRRKKGLNVVETISGGRRSAIAVPYGEGSASSVADGFGAPGIPDVSAGPGGG